MRLFSRRRLPDAGSDYAGPPAASMRGRAAAIADAGAVPWQVLWEALKTDAPIVDDSLVADLGLRTEDWRGPTGEAGGERMYGVRDACQVEIRIGRTERGLQQQGVQVTWVRALAPEFAATAADGVLGADDPAVAGIVDGFAPSRAWDGTELRGGREGIVARRPITMRGQQAGWAYDLWLCERIARELGSPLPPADTAAAAIPYGMG
jgi:hypothetical protein